MNGKQLVINIAGIGDLIMASKSLRALKRYAPERELWLLTSSEAAPLAVHYPYIDHVIPFPIRELGRNRLYYFLMLKTLYRLRQTHFQQCTNLYLVGSITGALKMGIVMSLLHAKIKAGHDAYGFGCFLSKSVPAGTFSKKHFVDAMSEIAALSGSLPDNDGLDVYWDRQVARKWQAFFESHKNTILIGLNPGGNRPNRRWPADRFAVVAETLCQHDETHLVLFGGTGEESLAHVISQHLDTSRFTPLAGRLNLSDLCFFISRLHLFITNDSGPMHIAAATGTPVVAIFGPENPRNLRPYAPESQYRAIYKTLSCRPCKKLACENHACLEAIVPDDILAACEDLMKGRFRLPDDANTR